MEQILIHILALFGTDALLRVASVCHRFQGIIIHIVRNRLLLAASLKNLKLILECYHPSAQYTEPYLFCEYLGTPGLSDELEGEDSMHSSSFKNGRLGELRSIYSRFRPTRPDADPPYYSHPAGDVPGSRTYSEISAQPSTDINEPVTQTINLDAHELFSQLCVSANLVKLGPRRGVFLSCIDVLRKTTSRIWREWLAENASKDDENPATSRLELTELAKNSDCKQIIWIDSNKHFGIRVRVRERKWRRNMPILMRKDEDQAISYSMELEGRSIAFRDVFMTL